MYSTSSYDGGYAYCGSPCVCGSVGNTVRFCQAAQEGGCNLRYLKTRLSVVNRSIRGLRVSSMSCQGRADCAVGGTSDLRWGELVRTTWCGG